jgi:hypothetical protein
MREFAPNPRALLTSGRTDNFVKLRELIESADRVERTAKRTDMPRSARICR